MNKPLIKRMSIMLICLAILFGGLITWRFVVMGFIKKALSQPMPPITVSTMLVTTENWQPHLTSAGALLAQKTVSIMPQAAGFITKIYSDSVIVKEGDPLLDLNDDIERANLAKDQATLKLAQANFKRFKSLYDEKVVSQADYDTALANIEQAKAAISNDNALIKQKHLVAPFNGALGIWQIGLGEYLTPGSKNIVTLQSLDPLLVQFSLTQGDLENVKIGQDVIFTMEDAFPGKEFKGKIKFNNIALNQDSRMLLTQALIENPDRVLAPGMYGTVKIMLPEIPNVIVVPQTAIEYNLYGDLIYVVHREGDKLSAKQVFVKVGQRRGDVVLIESGLKPGDEIITTGQVKLFEGAPIVPALEEHVSSVGEKTEPH
jgi:membrane fusion protein (multidrug efflux system)